MLDSVADQLCVDNLNLLHSSCRRMLAGQAVLVGACCCMFATCTLMRAAYNLLHAGQRLLLSYALC